MTLAAVRSLIEQLPAELMARTGRPKDIHLAARRVLDTFREAEQQEGLTPGDRRALLNRLMYAGVRVHQLIEEQASGAGRWSGQERYEMDNYQLFNDIALALGMSPQQLERV